MTKSIMKVIKRNLQLSKMSYENKELLFSIINRTNLFKINI